MTEAEWLAATDPTPMLKFLRGKASDRKLRLFAVACCRRICHLVQPYKKREGLEIAERYADGIARKEDIARFVKSHVTDFSLPIASIEANAAVIQPCLEDYSFDGSYAAYFASRYASVAMGHHQNSLRRRPAEILPRSLVEQEGREQVRLAQDMFCNPFRPISVNPTWLTPTVISLAQTMYDSRDFSTMPILADALQDAGCDNTDILGHCCSDGPHARGCWVVDLILGKE